ncbi:hypothetical protein [Streptomyces europaeiscabiei]|uniref:hypothetical protein n=1 Tax=Streptomyces europaeiscabiei TaxID=146819 RepID=UPI0029A836E9|nr:hypothetical protein [Streptomyces europaeiscabiei]MDX2524834.1 hypothetical protein [Streptomyces europaeiscabiei]MDX3784282.1 hypothetical protein [Streptomyces europaeiscabiei]
MITGTRARQVNDQEARDFGISTERICMEIEHVFYDADDEVLRHTVTVDYSGHPYVTRYQPRTRGPRTARVSGPPFLPIVG